MTNKPHPALHLSQLTVNYDRTPALWDVSCDIPSGKLVGIIGPNGAGKSTLIKAILGLVKPLSGKMEVLGLPSYKAQPKIAYVPQKESVDWDFPITVRNLVMMGRYGKIGLFRRPKAADWAAVDHYLEQVGMSSYASRQISQLSGGQQQRAFIARALAQEADVYFMDEPFAGIDLATESALMQLFRSLIAQGKTLFIVHHDLNTVEEYFNWVILLNVRLIASGKISEAFTPHHLNSCYGKSYALLDEAIKLSQSKTIGG
jgi:manganese/zinc/iron transport system ATP- binding protein